MSAGVAVFPCSDSQIRLWLLERLGRGGPALAVRAPLVLEHLVDPARAQRAVEVLVQRHEALRTTFSELDGQPVQRVREDADVVVPLTDLRGLPPIERRRRVLALGEELGAEPFDLTRGPLLRARLVLTGAASSVLLLVLHHIVVDGWSVRTVHDELRALLAADVPAGALPPVRTQYADYALWQAQSRRSARHEEHVRWWQDLHAGAAERPPLFGTGAASSGAVRTPALPTSARRLARELDPAVERRLRAFAAVRRATPFAVLLAAYAATLRELTGQTDLVVGCPVAGRTRSELEETVGFFVNTLPLRVRLADEAFPALVDRVRDLSVEAFERQDVSYEEIARRAGRPDRPLFEVMFNVLEGRALPDGPRARDEAPAPVAGSHSDAELYVFDHGDAMRLELVHDTRRLDEAGAHRLLDGIVARLADVGDGASGHVAGVALPRNPWPAGDGERSPTPLDRFRRVADAHPDRLAVDDGVVRLSYADLRSRVLAVGRAVAAAVDRGSRVGVLTPHDASAVVAVLGALAGGAAYVPLDPHSPAHRLAAVADDAGLGLVLTAPGAARAAAALADLRPRLERLDVTAPPPATTELPSVEPDALAYVIYTSGTTGTPKGVMQSHRNVLGNIRTYAEALGLGPSDALSLLPGIGTDAAVMDLFGALLTGAALHLVDLRAVGLDEVGERLSAGGVTVLHCTPSVLRGITASEDEITASPGPRLDRVRLVVLGGEPATRADLDAVTRHLPASAVLVNGYGPTECTVAMQFVARPGTAVPTEALPLGDPVAGVGVAVVDDAGREVGPGEVGEVVLTGAFVALGYWGRPEETARVFGDGAAGTVAPGTRSYRTGDLARVHTGGVLTFAGRADDQLKVRGVRVEPAEVEAVLRRQSGVLAAGVTARSPLTAHLVLAPGHAPSPRRLRRDLRRVLPDAMVPARYVAVDALPLTPSGKIDRRALAGVDARELHDRQADRPGGAAPADGTEAVLAAIWAEVLDVDAREIGRADTFFDFGGHSLLLTQVAARLADRLGVRLPLATLFEDLPLAELAVRIGGGEDGTGPTRPEPGQDRIRPRTTPGPYPLSSAQARLWFLEGLNPGSATYTMSTSVAVPAHASPEDVQAVLDELAMRHEALRTTFDVVDGRPVQQVLPTTGVPLRHTDLSLPDPSMTDPDHAGPGTAATRSEAIAVENAGSGFDLRSGPLLRAHLVTLPGAAMAGAGSAVLHLALHHIVVDGWSLRLLRDELALLLAARLDGRPSPLASPGLQYADYVLWERGDPRRLEAGLRWWAETLAGAPPVLDLPTCRPRPSVPTGRGALVSVPVDDGVVTACRALARRERVTPFMVYLAAFAVVLHRWSGQEDLVVGTPVAGRTRVETEDVVGLFVNSLPLRLAVRPDGTFLDLLARVREMVTAAQDHQDVPLEEIVRRVAPQRRLSHAPVFQVMFALGSTRGEGAAGVPGVAHTATAKFDLSMTVDDGAEPAVYLEYATDLYDDAAAHHLLAATVEVLARVAAEPRWPVDRLPLVREPGDAPDADPRAAVAGTPRASSPARPDPGGLAVVGPDSTTHAELTELARAVARVLRARGLGRGAVVAVDLPRGGDLVAAFLGVQEAGCALLLLDPRLPASRRADLLARSRTALVIDDEVLSAARSVPAGTLDAEPRAPDPDAPAYVVATSGSTGAPKLVSVPRRALDAQVAALVEAYGLTPADRVLQLAGLGFDVALEEILPTLAAGGTVDLGPAAALPSFAELDELCGPGGVTVLNLPASYWHEWVAALEQRPGGPTLPAGLRLVVVGSEPVNPAAVARWYGFPAACRLLCAYGTSETTITNALYEPARDKDWAAEARTPIGQALPTARLDVVDPAGRVVPPGVVGELAVEGVCVAEGYLDRPDLTAERFVTGATGRRYLTGDLARRRFDGDLEVLGRLDDQIKLAGHRIEPGEVEAALLRRPGVAGAAVAVRTSVDGHRRLVGYLVPAVGPAAGTGPDPTVLRGDLLRELPEHLVPTAFVTLDALPRTAGGKIDRAALPEPAAVPPPSEGPAPAGPVEQAVAEVWAETLRIPVAAVGATSNFFELGGDSILSLQVAWRLGARGLPVTLADVFAHQSVAELAARLVAAPGPAAPVAWDADAEEEVPLSPIQRWFLDTGSPEPWHDNQAVLLEVDASVTAAHLRTALHAVVARHDALRSRFERREDGWHARIAPDDDGAVALSVALRVHPSGTDMGLVAARAHASLDLAHGPLLRAELIEAPAREDGRAAELFLVAHHLVVDLVSWQVVLADLSAALAQLQAGAAPEHLGLAPVPTSWAQWTRRLAAWARADEAQTQVDAWLARRPAAGPSLPLRRRPAGDAASGDTASPRSGNGTAGDERVLRAALPAAATQALLTRAPRALGARVEDALLAAVATAVVEVLGDPVTGSAGAPPGHPGRPRPATVVVDVEGHGREPALPGVDLSRTVGWFTTLRPVTLAAGGGRPILDCLGEASEALRAVPGLAHGALRELRDANDPSSEALRQLPVAPISVNYVGRLDTGRPASGLLRPAGPAPGPARSPRAPRPYALDVVAGVREGGLVVWFTHGGETFDEETTAAVADRCIALLTALAEACDEPNDETPARGAAAGEVLAEYPLTPMQEAMVYGPESGAGSGVYVEHSVLPVPAGSDPARLRRAWEDAVARHDVLRTRFVEDEGGARRQQVMRAVALPWRVVDWRHLLDDEAGERLAGLLEDDRRRGFDPGDAPLMRFVLARLPDGDRLVWSHHHALLDGWSAARLLAEVAPSGAVAAPPRPFRDFVDWLRGRDPDADAAHWRASLAGIPQDGARLPRCDLRDGEPRARAVGAGLPGGLARSLRERARELRVGPATLVQAAWALVLREYTHSDDVVLGVTSSGRPADLEGADAMVGLFITTHPARVRLAPERSVADVVTSLAADEAVNRRHAHAGLLALARWAGLPAGTPLFESLLVVENYQRTPGGSGGRSDTEGGSGGRSDTEQPPVVDVPVREIPDVPLSVVVGADLDLTLVFDARRLERALVVDMLGTLQRALAVLAAAGPDTRVADLDVLGPDVRRRLVHEWNDTSRPLPRRSLGAQWVEAATRYGDAVAVDAPDGAVSYARLAAAAERVTALLRARGARPGDLVGVAGHRSARLVAAVLGVVQAGCAYVPLDPSYPDERLVHLVADSGMRLALADAAFVARLPAALRGNGAIPIDDVLDPDPGTGAGAGAGAGATLAEVGVDAPAYVIYTSGSTGRPKGVVVPHRAVTRLVVDTDYCRLGPGDAVAFASTFSFDASTFEIWGALLNGARLVPIDTDTVLEPRRLAVALRERRVTTMFITTAAFNAVAAAQSDAFAPLTTLLFGGERADPRRVREVLAGGPPERLLNVYGPTETTTFASWHEVRSLAEDAVTVPIGRPVANTSLLVLDDAGRLVPPGVEGELVIGGPGLAIGYLGDPGLTAHRFVPHPFAPGERLYRTGDVVVQRTDGTIEIRGRRDGQVKIRGFRIEPGEVETYLGRAPGVAAVVVVPRRESDDVHFLAAYVVPEAGAATTEADLRAFLRAGLPEHLVPATITLLAELPLTPNGKVDRDRLPDPRAGHRRGPQEQGEDPGAGDGAPSGTEAAVAAVWASVLAMEPALPGADQDFFELGGHSLLLTQVAGRLRRDLHVEVPLRVLFEARTVRALAAVVERAERTTDREIPLVDRGPYRGRVDEGGRLTVPPALRERLRRMGA